MCLQCSRLNLCDEGVLRNAKEYYNTEDNRCSSPLAEIYSSCNFTDRGFVFTVLKIYNYTYVQHVGNELRSELQRTKRSK